MNWTRLAVISTVALGVAASAFLALRPEDRPASRPGDAFPGPQENGSAPRTVPAPPPPPAPGQPSIPSPEQARRAEGPAQAPRQQAELEVNRIRDRLIAGCDRELRAAPRPLSFRIRLVFDANGREIIRGVTADQKSPQPIANCLTRVAAGTLRIEPTGRTVTTVVPLTIP